MTTYSQRKPKQKSNILTWLWLLVIAPGRVVTLHSPHMPIEVLRRLRSQPKIAQIVKPAQAIIRLPSERNQRRFYIWIEAEANGQTRISGQTQTPYRAALLRLLISLMLYGLSLVWLPAGRFWLGIIFILGGTGFLLLSQYERLIGRDLRLHTEWLRRALDATLDAKD